MKLMSFGLTTSQILAETKFVTRRVGWRDLAHGDFVQAVEKAQGLKKGEKVRRLKTLEVLEIRREPLERMQREPAYGAIECALEGFPKMTPCEFVCMFRLTHKRCKPETMVTRIKFRYVNHAQP